MASLLRGSFAIHLFFFTYRSVVVLLHSFKFYCPLCLSSMSFCNGSEIKKNKINPQYIFGTVFNSLSILCDHSLFSARRERGWIVSVLDSQTELWCFPVWSLPSQWLNVSLCTPYLSCTSRNFVQLPSNTYPLSCNFVLNFCCRNCQDWKRSMFGTRMFDFWCTCLHTSSRCIRDLVKLNEFYSPPPSFQGSVRLS